MRIAIMGSGGVGAYVGARLQAAGETVAFIARGAHLEAMRRDGLRLEGPVAPLHLPSVTATDDPSAVGPVDLVVFAVKLWDTAAAARAMAPMVGADTRVLTLQNGIDSVALISRELPAARVRGGVIYVSAVIDRPGVIRSPGGLHTIVADAAGGDPVMAAFAAASARAEGLDAKLTETIDLTIWEKFVALSALAATTSLLRSSMGPILAHPETCAMQRQLVEEGVAVARAAGHPLRDGLVDEILARMASFPGSFRSSMSEDLERGKPLELGWLSGRVHRLGLELGVPTPAHTAAYRGLVLYEQGAAAGVAPAPARPAALEAWHRLVETRDRAGLLELLAEDAVFHSPIVHTPQRGRARTFAYLSAAFDVFFGDGFRYVREVVSPEEAVLEFEVEIDGVQVDGVDMIRWNAAGKVVDFKVMIRPLKAIEVIHRKMAAALEAAAAGRRGG
jgi:2-dehydropantoate 2-reductase